MDAVDEAVDTLYTKLLADPKTIVPAATPSIDIKNIDKDHIEVEFTLVANPEVKLGKYKDLGIKRDKIEVSKEEIDHELGHLKEQFVELKACDDNTKIKNGMVAVIDFEGFVNGEAFKGGKGEDYNLEIGSNTFIPGFEEALVGLKKGDKKDVEVTFPENYHAENLKGKPATFKVEVKEVKERVMPELNKEFFEDLNVAGVESEADLRKYITEQIEAEKSKKVEDEFLFKCLDKIVENSKFEIPEELTNDEVNRLVKEFRERLQYQGLNFEDYLKFANTNLDDFKETLKPEANKRVGYRLVMDAIVNKEKLEVTNDELDDELNKQAEQYKMAREDFEKEIGSVELFKYDMVVKKAMKIITE
jgi:trigger factor